MYDPTAERKLIGVECVIDKDRASPLSAREIGADVLVIATDVPAVFLGYGAPEQKAIKSATPDALDT